MVGGVEPKAELGSSGSDSGWSFFAAPSSDPWADAAEGVLEAVVADDEGVSATPSRGASETPSQVKAEA